MQLSKPLSARHATNLTSLCRISRRHSIALCDSLKWICPAPPPQRVIPPLPTQQQQQQLVSAGLRGACLLIIDPRDRRTESSVAHLALKMYGTRILHGVFPVHRNGILLPVYPDPDRNSSMKAA
jgi:hypothetical protein